MTIQTLCREEVASVSGARGGYTLPIIAPLVSNNLVGAVLGEGFTGLGDLFKNKLISGIVEVGGGSLSKLLSRFTEGH